jgi:RNA-directed DNA polymerase
VEDEGIAEKLTTPETIRTLQRKLYRKAKQEPACRFHTLYDKIYRADILGHAYALVCADQSRAWIDGVTFKAIKEQEGATAFFLKALEEALNGMRCR